jgi:hypothetical protein
MSSSLPAQTSRPVTAWSSGDGVGSPLGWLWTRTTAAARPWSTLRNTSRGMTGIQHAARDRQVAVQAVLRVEPADAGPVYQRTAVKTETAIGLVRGRAPGSVGTRPPMHQCLAIHAHNGL